MNRRKLLKLLPALTAVPTLAVVEGAAPKYTWRVVRPGVPGHTIEEHLPDWLLRRWETRAATHEPAKDIFGYKLNPLDSKEFVVYAQDVRPLFAPGDPAVYWVTGECVLVVSNVSKLYTTNFNFSRTDRIFIRRVS